MEDWVLERLGEFVGRSDRKGLGSDTARRLTPQSMGEHSSYRVDRNLPSLGRGLVIAEEGVISDYPRVRRVFHLTNAIVKYYYSPFFLEAQVPGYQARVAWLGGRQVAFTRDGRYCAFASDRAADFIPAAFFEENPELIVCLAIGGAGIPYAKPSHNGGAEDIVAWGTEILEHGVREPLATADKYELFAKYGIESAEHVGPFGAGDVDKIVGWMREFEAAGGTGVILKPSERHHRPLKYSLPSALLTGAPAWLGLDGANDEDPHFERLLQAACAATELGMPADDWDWEAVGRSLLSSLAGLTQQVAEAGALASECSVWLHDKDAAEELLVQLDERAPGASIQRLGLEAENDGWRLRFERRFTEATAAIERRLSGASYRD